MPKLIVKKGPMKGRTFFFGGNVAFAGRSGENDIQLEGREVSRKHFKIMKKGKKFYVEDLKSRNGTRLNGELIVPGNDVEVEEKDTLSIANSDFQLSGLFEDTPSPEKEPLTPQSSASDSEQENGSVKERRTPDRKNLELIWEVTELLRQSLGINEVLEKVLKHIMNSLPRIDTAAILLYDMRKEQIVETFATERFESVMEEVRFSQSIVDRVIKSGKAIRMSNTKYEASKDISDSITDLKIMSAMCVPLISNEEILGAIYVDARGVYGFRKDDLLLINSLSGPIAVAVEKAMLASELEAVPFTVDES